MLVCFRIKDVLPQLAEECNPSSKQITNQDAETINKYCEVSTHLTKRLDLSCRIRDYDHVFKKLIIEKELDFRGFKDINDVYYLICCLDKFMYLIFF